VRVETGSTDGPLTRAGRRRLSRVLDTASSGPENVRKTRIGAPRERALGRTEVGRKGAQTTKNPVRFAYAPFCSGDVYVASQSHYVATSAHFDDQVLSGEMKVTQKQQILGAKGLCLSAMAGDSVESQQGTFAYRPMPAGTTCQSLTGKPWPVKAQTPPPAKPAQ
jgi:hypothetical protein